MCTTRQTGVIEVGGTPVPTPTPYAAPAPVRPKTPHRRRLWEIHRKYHCPIVGTCLTVEELRKLACRAGLDGWDSESDYALHSTAVGLARDRNGLSDPMQKLLERKFEATIRRFSRAKSGDEVLSLWSRALAEGEVKAALWAALSHGCADEQLAQLIYEDVHMLSHQVGASSHASLGELSRLRRMETELTAKITRMRERHAAQLSEKEADIRALNQRLTRIPELEQRLGEAENRLHTSHQGLANTLPDAGKQRLEMESRRATQAEKRCAELEARLKELQQSHVELQGEWEAAEDTLARMLDPSACHGCEEGQAGHCSNGNFSGCCILCVGGRTGLADQYRALVERGNGRFIHHDGGLEDNPRRLPALLSSADAVICPADNVSHGAYYVVKRLCKQYGKPCIMLKRSGLSTFARGLAELAVERTASDRNIHENGPSQE